MRASPTRCGGSRLWALVVGSFGCTSMPKTGLTSQMPLQAALCGLPVAGNQIADDDSADIGASSVPGSCNNGPTLRALACAHVDA